ncbi:diacylglycerol/lipid kinase family protein [Occultella kanbiaonis]|uniref:diacylglycerol/lipid kinase family protein n=1 Tax=Occultella kanbiaonis TaxID=2675754 RepID=UPI001F35CDEF|nr:diacylglycerol kinase family protein [Occultella kanbiaonis]
MVIVNPTNVDLPRLRSAVASAQEQHGWLPTVWLETTADDAGQRAATLAVVHDPVVAGGDGTIRAVTEELHSSGIPIAVVPAGTGNLLARNLGLLRDMETAARTAFTGATRTIDVGLVSLVHDDGSTTSHAFLVMTGVGLDARMATDTSGALKTGSSTWCCSAPPGSGSGCASQPASGSEGSCIARGMAGPSCAQTPTCACCPTSGPARSRRASIHRRASNSMATDSAASSP